METGWNFIKTNNFLEVWYGLWSNQPCVFMGFVAGSRLGFVAAPALGAEQTCKPRRCCPTCACGIGLEEVLPNSTTGVRTQKVCWAWGWQNICSDTFSVQFRWAGLCSKTKPGSQSSVCRDPCIILPLCYLICSEDAPTPLNSSHHDTTFSSNTTFS